MFFYPSDISHFHSFGCPLVSQLGSLRRKCDPDKCTQNSHKSCLCFLTHQTFSIFIPLVVPLGPDLDPCSKNVILAGARKIYIKVVCVCFAHQAFASFIPLAVPWGSNLGPCCNNVILTGAREIHIKVVYVFFTHQTFPIFIPLVVPWSPSLDPCCKNVILTSARKNHIKVVYAFLPIRHFPFPFLWLSLGIPTGVLDTKVWSWRARAKFT